ncbi:MAG: family 16 glycoside hydrolase, partial [Candidatus Omnitrophota bacterium]
GSLECRAWIGEWKDDQVLSRVRVRFWEQDDENYYEITTSEREDGSWESRLYRATGGIRTLLKSQIFESSYYEIPENGWVPVKLDVYGPYIKYYFLSSEKPLYYETGDTWQDAAPAAGNITLASDFDYADEFIEEPFKQVLLREYARSQGKLLPAAQTGLKTYTDWRTTDGGAGLRYEGLHIGDLDADTTAAVFKDGYLESGLWIGKSVADELHDETKRIQAGIRFKIAGEEGQEDYYELIVEEYTTGGWSMKLDRYADGAYSTTFATTDISSMVQENAWLPVKIGVFDGRLEVWIEDTLELQGEDAEAIQEGGAETFTRSALLPAALSGVDLDKHVAKDEDLDGGETVTWNYESDEIAPIKTEVENVVFNNGILRFNAWIPASPSWLGEEDYPYQKAGVEFRVTGTDDHYALVIEEYTTGAYRARLDEFRLGQYESTLAMQDITINENSWISATLSALGGHFELRVEGALAFEVDDPSPISRDAEGALRLIIDASLPPETVEAAVQGLEQYSIHESAWLPDSAGDWKPVNYAEDWGISTDGAVVTLNGLDLKENVTTRSWADSFHDGVIDSSVWVGKSLAEEMENEDYRTEAGLIFRQSMGDYYYLVIEEYTTGAWMAELRKYDNDILVDTLGSQDVTSLVDENSWVGLKVSARGGHFEVWVNGEYLFGAYDADPIIVGEVKNTTGPVLLPDTFDVVSLQNYYYTRNYASTEDLWQAYTSGNWIMEPYDTGVWKITGDGKTLGYRGLELVEAVTVALEGEEFHSGILRTKLWMGESPDRQMKTGVDFRVTENDDYYSLIVEEYTTDAYRVKLDKFVGGVYSTTLSSAEVTSFINENTWQEVRINPADGHFFVWIGDEDDPVMECDDADFINEYGGTRLMTGPVLLPKYYDNFILDAADYFEESHVYRDEEWEARYDWDWKTEAFGAEDWDLSLSGADLAYEGLELVQDVKLDILDVDFEDGVIKSMGWVGETPAWIDLNEDPIQLSGTGLEFRVADTGEFYALVVNEYTTDGWKAELLKYAGGEYTTLATTPLADKGVAVEAGSWISFMIYADKGVIKAWVEDTLVLECEDAAFIDKGGIRLISEPALLPTVFDASEVMNYYAHVEKWEPEEGEDWGDQVFGAGNWSVNEDGSLAEYMGTEVEYVDVEAEEAFIEDGNIRARAWVGQSLASMDSDFNLKAGVNFRIQSEDDYYALVAEEYTTGQWEARIEKVVAGVYTTLASVSLNELGAALVENDWAKFRIYASGGRIEVWVNDIYVISCADPDPAAGGAVKVFSGPVLLPTTYGEPSFGDTDRFRPGWVPVSSGDWTTSGTETNLEISDSGENVTYTGLERGDCKLEPANLVFRNGVIEFKALVQESQHAKIGMEFRATDDGDSYIVVVEEKYGVQGFLLKLQKCVAGEYTTLVEKEVPVVENEWFSFRIYARDRTIKVSINDVQLIDYNDKDKTYAEEGAVRFLTGYTSPGAFDDFVIKSSVFDEGLAATEVFTSGDFADWTPAVDNGKWELSDDGKEITQKKVDTLSHLMTLDGFSERDAVISMGISPDGNTTGRAGVILRSDQNLENYLEILLDPAGGWVYLNRVDDMVTERIASGVVPKMTDGWYQLKVKAIGERIEVYVNGRKIFNAVDPQFKIEGRGSLAVFTARGARASFRDMQVSNVKAFSDMASELTADEQKLVKALETLARTKDFDGNMRVDSEDRELYEIIGSDKFDFSTGAGIHGVNMELLNDLSNAAQYTCWDEVTNTILGDVNLDGKTNELDTENIERIIELTSDANAQYYIEDILGLDLSNLHTLATRTSSGKYTTALGDDDYTFIDLEFLIRYSDLNGDGAVNYKDTKLLVENVMFYEFLSAVKDAMEAIEFIPSAAYGPLELIDYENWGAGLKEQFLLRLNEYLATMDTTGGVSEYRDYNCDGTVDFKDRYIYEHYSVDLVAEQDIINAATYRVDVDGDGEVAIDDTLNGFNDLTFIRNIFDLTHEAVSPDEVAIVDVDGNGRLDAADVAMFTDLQKYYVDLNGDGTVDFEDLLALGETVIRKQVADVNLDGIINELDKTAVNALVGTEDTLYDIAKTLAGDTMQFTRTVQAPSDGNYRLELRVKAVILETEEEEEEEEKEPVEIPAGYKFKFKVSIGGLVKGTIEVDPSMFDAAHGYIYLDLGKANYSASFEWTNPIEGIGAYVESVVLASSANLNGNNVVDLQDVTLLTRLIDNEIASGASAAEKMDMDKDGDVDWDDRDLMRKALDAVKDVNEDGVVDDADTERLEYIVRLEEIKELHKAADVNRDNKIEQLDIDTLNTVRMLDLDADQIIGTAIAGQRTDWRRLDDILFQFQQSGNKDYIVLGLMADLEMTVKLFQLLDRNNDGVFDILDMPEGIDPSRFQDYNVFREGDPKDPASEFHVLSYLDETVIQKSVANLLFTNKFTEEEMRRADVNEDGVVDFKDYDRLSELYNILYEGVDRDLDSSGGVPDEQDLEVLRKIAVIITEGDINGDGNRNAADRNIILQAMGGVEKRYEMVTSCDGFLFKEIGGTRVAQKTPDQNKYSLTYKVTVPEGGYYDFGISARADKPLTMPEGEPYEDTNNNGVHDWNGPDIPGTDEPFEDLNGNGMPDMVPMYILKLYIDEKYKGYVGVMGDERVFIEGSMTVFIPEEKAGEEMNVRFEWANAGYRYINLDRDSTLYESEGWIAEPYFDANDNGRYDQGDRFT